MRLQYGVTGFPPQWKSSRSTALIVHVFIMSQICVAHNSQDVSFMFGTKVLAGNPGGQGSVDPLGTCKGFHCELRYAGLIG
jgi:hypothetical protein